MATRSAPRLASALFAAVALVLTWRVPAAAISAAKGTRYRFDSADFASATFGDNGWLPLVPGLQWVRERVGADETAFAYRDVNFSPVIAGMWDNPTDNDRNIAWVRGYYDALQPYSTVDG